MSEKKFKEKIAELKNLYPKRRSAIMPTLHYIQREKGFISKDDLSFIAREFGVTEIEIRSVVSFYTMYKTKPLGKYHFRFCHSLVCEINGSNSLSNLLLDKFGITENQVSDDGLWSYEFVECLGACNVGPVVLVNDTIFEKMTVEKLKVLISEIEEKRPDLDYKFE